MRRSIHPSKRRLFDRVHDRAGGAAVEFAICGPILFLIVLSAFEFTRANMIRNTCEIAATEGARKGIIPGATATDCENEARSELDAIGVHDYTITVTPNPLPADAEDITVRVEVPLSMPNGYIIPQFLFSRSVTKEINLKRE
jgi:Flp pilus assembly protein TadG